MPGLVTPPRVLLAKLPSSLGVHEVNPMLSATCHCGAVRVEVPEPPESLTDCNCSICRRYGTLWAYYKAASVTISGHPENTEGYVWGDKTLRFSRCRTCGCVTHWEPLELRGDSKVGVNARIFEPGVLGDVRIRRLDGAETWAYLD